MINTWKSTYAHSLSSALMAATMSGALGSPTARIVVSLCHFGAVLHCLNKYGVDVSMTKGPSMRPTFNDSGDVVLTEKWSYRGWQQGGICRGDVVVAKSPGNPRQTICKRVVALPGEMVTVRGSFGSVARRAVPPGHV